MKVRLEAIKKHKTLENTTKQKMLHLDIIWLIAISSS